MFCPTKNGVGGREKFSDIQFFTELPKFVHIFSNIFVNLSKIFLRGYNYYFSKNDVKCFAELHIFYLSVSLKLPNKTAILQHWGGGGYLIINTLQELCPCLTARFVPQSYCPPPPPPPTCRMKRLKYIQAIQYV